LFHFFYTGQVLTPILLKGMLHSTSWIHLWNRNIIPKPHILLRFFCYTQKTMRGTRHSQPSTIPFSKSSKRFEDVWIGTRKWYHARRKRILF
jgi:hypothetical protein